MTQEDIMTQEDKQLLLKDLCGRLPYGFTVHRYSDNRDIIFEPDELDEFAHFLEYSEGEDFKPYLRPISSMTEEEIEFMGENGFRVYKKTNCFDNNDDGWDKFYVDKQSFEGVIELFYSHHLDYHGLIPMGLALEAPDNMYKTE